MRQRHPRGLFTLLFVEMWERLGFYLILGILYLYIVDTERGGLGLAGHVAGEIYGTYIAFLYVTPMVGGLVADRALGFRRSVLLGGLLMASGYFCLGVRSLPWFMAGLTLVCLGNGLFKPNISVMVGNLYAPGDPRRDTGFNLFYMGINAGACLSALLAAVLRNVWSFNAAFVAAGIGLLAGLVVLVVRWKPLAAADRRVTADTGDLRAGQLAGVVLVPARAAGLAGAWLGQRVGAIADTIGPITFGFLVATVPIAAYFARLVARATPEERPGLAALAPVFVAGAAFALILHLSGGLLTIYAERHTDRRASWIPDALDVYAQRAMPSYFANAGPDVPRPDPRTLLVVSDDEEAMFGARAVDAQTVGHLAERSLDGVEFVDPARVPADQRFLAVGVYPDASVVVAAHGGAHGGAAPAVSVRAGAEASQHVVATRTLDGARVALLPVSRATAAAVEAGTDEGTPALPPGQFLRLVNTELITAFLAPVLVVGLTPAVVAFFEWRRRRGRPVRTARKIVVGLLLASVSLAVLALATVAGGNGAIKTAVWWLVAYYVILTVGEVCLQPMGLSLVTKLAAPRLAGLMMGLWFLSGAVGNKLAGFVSGLEPTTTVFGVLAASVLLVAAGFALLLPRLDAAISRYGA